MKIKGVGGERRIAKGPLMAEGLGLRVQVVRSALDRRQELSPCDGKEREGGYRCRLVCRFGSRARNRKSSTRVHSN